MLVLVCVGCGSASKVILRDGTEYDGYPIKSDRTRLAFQTENGRVIICKRDIHDVDHGGDGAALGGTALAAGGLAIVVASQLQDEPEGDANYAFPASLFGVAIMIAGAAIAMPAFGRWSDARDATGWPPKAEDLRERCSTFEEFGLSRPTPVRRSSTARAPEPRP